MDQAGSFKAGLMASLIVRVTYNFIHTGRYNSKLMQKRYESQMADPDPYNRAFVAITGRNKQRAERFVFLPEARPGEAGFVTNAHHTSMSRPSFRNMFSYSPRLCF